MGPMDISPLEVLPLGLTTCNRPLFRASTDELTVVAPKMRWQRETGNEYISLRA